MVNIINEPSFLPGPKIFEEYINVNKYEFKFI